ncbi:Protein of unknown function [Parasphingorhabdus marina DSM 22363]|uniref:DUF4238 domain-containing protein n=1 Tax=Parasphingorhabdus marina DSM 22363 TaxID=1123272 RepID=A0A1N6CLW9_9SPHN|nr:DUF4238 domain-containing protein [Parasphingorhabdus marina]SIN59573.1 Protein of unknown function [Parasphingorhabdus marina DSM 22363]
MKQHFIPEFLLKNWCGDDGRLERYTSPIDGKIVSRRVFPSATGFQKDIYTLDDVATEHRHHIELEFFQKVDSLAAKTFYKILNREIESMSDDDIVNWARFVYSLMHRVPQSIEMWKEKWRSTQLSDGSFLNDSEAVEMAKQNLPFFIESERTVLFIAQMDWHVVRTDSCRFQLLVSEQPIVMTNGLMREDGHIALPISPTEIFLAIRTDSNFMTKLKRQKLEEVVRNLNRQVVERASHFVAASDKSQERFIVNRFGKSKLDTVQSIFG